MTSPSYNSNESNIRKEKQKQRGKLKEIDGVFWRVDEETDEPIKRVKRKIKLNVEKSSPATSSIQNGSSSSTFAQDSFVTAASSLSPPSVSSRSTTNTKKKKKKKGREEVDDGELLKIDETTGISIKRLRQRKSSTTTATTTTASSTTSTTSNGMNSSKRVSSRGGSSSLRAISQSARTATTLSSSFSSLAVTPSTLKTKSPHHQSSRPTQLRRHKSLDSRSAASMGIKMLTTPRKTPIATTDKFFISPYGDSTLLSFRQGSGQGSGQGSAQGFGQGSGQGSAQGFGQGSSSSFVLDPFATASLSAPAVISTTPFAQDSIITVPLSAPALSTGSTKKKVRKVDGLRQRKSSSSTATTTKAANSNSMSQSFNIKRKSPKRISRVTSLRSLSQSANTAATLASSVSSVATPPIPKKSPYQSPKQPRREISLDSSSSSMGIEMMLTPARKRRNKSLDFSSSSIEMLTPRKTNTPIIATTSSSVIKIPKLKRHGSLDMLTSQNVHECSARKKQDKPSLNRSTSTLGDFFRRSSIKEDDSKSMEVIRQLSPPSASSKFLPSNSTKQQKQKSRKNVRKIDGILWRLDDDGNKIKKIRRKSSIIGGGGGQEGTAEGDCAATTTGHSAADGNKKNKSRRSRSHSAADGNNKNKDRHSRSNRSVQRRDSNSSKNSGASGSTTGSRGGKRGDGQSKSVGKNGNDNGNSNGNISTPASRGRKRTTSENVKINLDASASSIFDASDVKINLDATASSIFDASESNSIYLDEAPKVVRRCRSRSHSQDSQIIRDKDGTKVVVDSATGKRLRPKSKKTHIKKLSEKNGENQKPSSESHMKDVDPDTAIKMVQKVQRQLKQSHRETKKIKSRYQTVSKEKKQLDTEIQILKTMLDEKENLLRKHQLESHQQQNEIAERNSNGGSGSDHLVEQITELMNENKTLLDKMGVEEAQAGIKLKQKDEELRFLQEELKHMRNEKGERDFSVSGGGNASKMNDNSVRGIRKPASLRMVDTIWNQKKDITNEIHRKQLKALQDRVDSLQVSNDKLKSELGKVTLTINDDDDDEIRQAKEVAKAVSERRLTRSKSAIDVKDALMPRQSIISDRLGMSTSLHASNGSLIFFV
jgi:hypothetical protein